MFFCVAVTDSFPNSPIPFPNLWTSIILFIPFVFLLLMLQTKPTICKLWTSWVRTRTLWFSRHLQGLLSCIIKTLQAVTHKAFVILFFLHYNTIIRWYSHSITLTLIIIWNNNFLQCRAMHTMYMLNRIVHIHRNLLPSDKAKISLFKKSLIFYIRYCLYYFHYFLF